MSECENCEQLDYAAIIGDAVRFERERIIKLLESCGCKRLIYPCSHDLAVALIKGENK